MGITLGRAKFQPFTPRGTYSNWGLNGQGKEKMRVFQRLYLGNGERYSEVTINH